MKNNKLIIQINKPIAAVFDFTISPKNTPLWIESVVQEETNEWPVGVGTVYKSQNKKGESTTYKMIEFTKNESFIMDSGDGNYHVRYTFKDLGENLMELEYHEWVDSGELQAPFGQDVLEKLKTILEQ